MPRRVYPNLRAYLKAQPYGELTRLAAELDIEPSYVSMLQWRQRQPSLELALRIAERCNVPLESMIAKPLAKVG